MHKKAISESFIFNNNDLEVNVDRFESGESNVLLVTGFPGSGKTSLARTVAEKYDCTHYQLDCLSSYLFRDYTIDKAIEEGEDGLVAYLRLKHSESGNEDELLIDKETNDVEGELIREYIKFLIDWCKKQPNRKFVIEGYQIYNTFQTGDFHITSCPIIIKGTSSLVSAIRAAKRDDKSAMATLGALVRWAIKDNVEINRLKRDIRAANNFEDEVGLLTEAKADTQKLIDFAGKELADRFIAVRARLKTPENDLYYWIKNKTVRELEQAVLTAENSKSKTQQKKETERGAELVCETDHWKVYHITTYEAAQKYGRDSKWCITGVNNYGDRYWKSYTSQGVKFYFLITKGEYDPRGYDSKFALALYPDRRTLRVFNQQDSNVNFSEIPYSDAISIPDIDLNELTDGHYCENCGDDLLEGDEWIGPDGSTYCDACFHERFALCDYCQEYFDHDDMKELPNSEYVCNSCFKDSGYDYCEYCDELCEEEDLVPNAFGEAICITCWPDYLYSDTGCVDRFIYIAEGDFESALYSDDEQTEIDKIVTNWYRLRKYGHGLRSCMTENQLTAYEIDFIREVSERGLKVDYKVFENPAIDEVMSESITVNNLKESFARDFSIYENLWS